MAETFKEKRIICSKFPVLYSKYPSLENWKFSFTGCGEKIFTLQLYIMFRVVWMTQRFVIQRSNGNFVGFPKIILKIVKNCPMKRNSNFSGEWQIWPTRNWNLTLNFEAIWVQYGIKCLKLVYSHSNIILEWNIFGLRLIRGHRLKMTDSATCQKNANYAS